MSACFGHFQPKKWTIRLFFSYSGGGLQWFVVVCLHRLWFHCLFPNSGGDVWWFAVMCGGFGFFSGNLWCLLYYLVICTQN